MVDTHRLAEVRAHLNRIKLKAPPGIDQAALDAFVNMAKDDISDEDIIAAVMEHDAGTQTQEQENIHDEY